MNLFNLTRSRGELIPLTSFIGLIALVYALFDGQSLYWWLIPLGLTAFFFIVLIEAYAHRYCTHHSYKMNSVLDFILGVLMLVVPATGSPVGWAAVHTAHHKYSDTPKDPHSNKYSSFLKLLMWDYPYTGNLHMSKRLLERKYHKHIHKYAVLYMIGWALLWYLLLGINGLVYVVLIMWFLGGFLSTFYNYFLHWDLPFSYRNYDTPDNSRNSPILHFFSFFSVGLHNTHHAKPWAWNTAEKWWEIDTSAWVIRLIRKKEV